MNYSNRETMYVSDMLGDDYGQVLVEQGYTFKDANALAEHLALGVEDVVSAVVEWGSDVKFMVENMLGYVEWVELADEFLAEHPELIEETEGS